VPVGLASHATLTSAFAGDSRLVVRWTRAVEAVVLAVVVTLVSATAFTPMPRYPVAQVIVLFAPVPLVLYAALRFGLPGAALALMITACGAMRGAALGPLPFPGSPAGTGIVVRQLVFVTVAVPFLVLAAALDERRRAAAQMVAAEARYNLATVAGHVFVYAYDPASGSVVTDSALGTLLRVPPFELQSPTWWWRQVHPEDAGSLQRTWSGRLGSVNAGATESPTDFRLLDREGHIRWFRDYAAPFHPADVDDGTVVGTVADITALKAVEHVAEQRSRELAHVARTAVVGELAAALAHEIRQPLTAILINAQTAMRVLDTHPRDPEAVREILQQLTADGRRASEVVQRVLEEIGLHVWFRYEKYREEYAAEDVTIAIDETPVGTFVEIEGGEEGILAIAKALGRTPSDFLLDSYRALFIKHRDEFGLTGTNMVFSEE